MPRSGSLGATAHIVTSTRRTRRLRPALALAALAVAVMLLGAACAGSGFAFASSADGQAYFRVPSNWHVFPTQEMLRAQQLQSPGAATEFKWMAGYDSANAPSISHVLTPVTDAPIVLAYQRDLSLAERD